MALSEDLSVFFNPDEFGVAVTVAGTPIVGILNEDYGEEDDIEGTEPELHVATGDLPGATADGSTVVIGARTFTVRGIRPDESQAVTILDLEYVSG